MLVINLLALQLTSFLFPLSVYHGVLHDEERPMIVPLLLAPGQVQSAFVLEYQLHEDFGF